MEEFEIIINDIRCATFHMNDEEAIPVIDEYLIRYLELLNYHDRKWYYENC